MCDNRIYAISASELHFREAIQGASFGSHYPHLIFRIIKLISLKKLYFNWQIIFFSHILSLIKQNPGLI